MVLASAVVVARLALVGFGATSRFGIGFEVGLGLVFALGVGVSLVLHPGAGARVASGVAVVPGSALAPSLVTVFVVLALSWTLLLPNVVRVGLALVSLLL